MKAESHRVDMLDCLRGFAAIAIVWIHTYRETIFASGVLTVDLFFILSGYVIEQSYGQSVQANKLGFLVKRFVRLYPMLFFGAVAGIALAVVHAFLNSAPPQTYADMVMPATLSLFAIPYLKDGFIGNTAYSFNPPMWSLFFELLANIFYCIFARYLSVRTLVAIVTIGLIGVFFIGIGDRDSTIFVGVPKVIVGFFGGVLLFRLCKSGWLPTTVRAPSWLLYVVLLVLITIPVGSSRLLILPAYAVLFAVVLAAVNTGTSKSDRLFMFFGAVSYPVYLIHWLTLFVFTYLGAKVGLSGNLYVVVALVHFVTVPILGWLVLKYYEEPVRRWLGRALRRPAVQGAIRT